MFVCLDDMIRIDTEADRRFMVVLDVEKCINIGKLCYKPEFCMLMLGEELDGPGQGSGIGFYRHWI